MSYENRVADAVMCGRYYPTGTSDDRRLQALKAEFGPVLGCDTVDQGDYMGGVMSFVTPHPRPKRTHDGFGTCYDDYDWKDRGDGVLYGKLKKGLEFVQT